MRALNGMIQLFYIYQMGTFRIFVVALTSLLTVVSLDASNDMTQNLQRPYDPIRSLKMDVNQAKISIDRLVGSLKTGSGPITTSNSASGATGTLTSTIPELSSHIDQIVARVNRVLTPYTKGTARAIGNAILGSLYGSVTNCIFAIHDSLVSTSCNQNSENVASDIGTLFVSLERLIDLGKNYNIDFGKVQEGTRSLQKIALRLVSTTETSKDILKRQFITVDVARGELALAQSSLEELTNDIMHDSFYNTADHLVIAIEAVDAQIENGLQTIKETMGPFEKAMAVAVGNMITRPFYNSVTNAAKALVPKVLSHKAQLLDTEIARDLKSHLSLVIQQVDQLHIDIADLTALAIEVNEGLITQKPDL